MRAKSLVCLVVSLILLGSLLVVGCSPAAAPTGEAPTRVTIGAGSIGGTSNLIANAWAGVLKKFQDIDATVITYPMNYTAPAAVTGETELSVSNTQLSYDSYYGLGPHADRGPLPDMREVMPLYDGPLQIWVTVDSPYKTFRDLIGKRIGPGTKGMGPESFLAKGLPALGLDWEKDFDLVYSSHKEGGSALVSGKIAAYMATSKPPHPTLLETDLTRPLRLIGFTDEDAAALTKAVPGVGVQLIPPDFYHMDVAVKTISAVGQGITKADFSEDIVYWLIRNARENTEFIGYYYKTHQEWLESGDVKYWVEASPSPTDVPLHKAAVRYYKEIGWNVPPERIPPEAQ